MLLFVGVVSAGQDVDRCDMRIKYSTCIWLIVISGEVKILFWWGALSKDRLVFTDWLLFKIDDLNIIRSKMFIVISSAKKLQIAKVLNCFEGKDDTIQRIKR